MILPQINNFNLGFNDHCTCMISIFNWSLKRECQILRYRRYFFVVKTQLYFITVQIFSLNSMLSCYFRSLLATALIWLFPYKGIQIISLTTFLNPTQEGIVLTKYFTWFYDEKNPTDFNSIYRASLFVSLLTLFKSNTQVF